MIFNPATNKILTLRGFDLDTFWAEGVSKLIAFEASYGDISALFSVGDIVRVTGNDVASNNRLFTVASSGFSFGQTKIGTDEVTQRCYESESCEAGCLVNLH